MQVKNLKIKGVRKITDAVLNFDKPLICLYGEVEQGKTSFVDCIKILFSSGFPDDLIQHGKEEASIELNLENGVISRSFYISKEGEIKARPLNAIVNNKKLSAKELQSLFNPFQLNQDFLKEMTSLERKKFFIELFDVDTKEIDNQIKEAEENAKNLRKEIEIYGNPLKDVEKIEKPEIEKLQLEEKEEKEKLNAIVLKNRSENAKLKEQWQKDNELHLLEIQKFNSRQRLLSGTIDAFTSDLNKVIDLCERTGFINFFNEVAAKEFIEKQEKPQEEKPIKNLPEPNYKDEKEGCNTDKLNEIQAKISDAKADEIKYQNYCNAVKKQQEKESKETGLKQLENNLRDLRKQKISKLAKYGKEIVGLAFNENGDLTFEGSANDNLSTSQIVRLGSLLSKLYPDSLLDLELIDRGESLGKKIWDFIEKAKNEEKTILATIVGEKPANVPDEVGVFVVENGNLIQ